MVNVQNVFKADNNVTIATPIEIAAISLLFTLTIINVII